MNDATRPDDTPRQRMPVLGVPIDALDWPEALARIAAWAVRRESRMVCLCNVHSVVTARSDAAFGAAVQSSDLATPDGAPVAWLMRRLRRSAQPRINGPDLMWRYCAEAAQRDESIYLYGGSPQSLQLLQQRLRQAFPSLRIAGACSPPFRALSAAEDDAAVRDIVASGAGTVWVGLGCPKQELWMASHRDRIPAVLIGVGAAFDYHAGTLRRAPPWMQRCGLEWLYRLLKEPRRLWRRYLHTNSVFVIGALQQLLGRSTQR